MAENFLTKQVAGQPVGVWAVVVVGGLGIAYYINRTQGPEAREEPLTEPGVGTGLVPAGAAIVPGTPSEEETGFENNSQWGIAALNWLVGQGHDPAVADAAVRKYLVAEQLSVRENALITLVLVNLGAPPEDLPPAPAPEQPVSGDPKLTTDEPHTQNVPIGGRITATGRVTIGGEAPGSPQIIRFTSYSKSMLPIRRWVTLSNNNGEFSTTLGGWGAKGIRAYEMAWKDSSLIRYVRVG